MYFIVDTLTDEKNTILELIIQFLNFVLHKYISEQVQPLITDNKVFNFCYH